MTWLLLLLLVIKLCLVRHVQANPVPLKKHTHCFYNPKTPAGVFADCCCRCFVSFSNHQDLYKQIAWPMYKLYGVLTTLLLLLRLLPRVLSPVLSPVLHSASTGPVQADCVAAVQAVRSRV
jgi:hypothetical protein